MYSLSGNLAACSAAADRQTKQNVNPDIESDYERDSNCRTQEDTPSIGMKIFAPLLCILASIWFTEPSMTSPKRLTSFPFKGYFFISHWCGMRVAMYLELHQQQPASKKIVDKPPNESKSFISIVTFFFFIS